MNKHMMAMLAAAMSSSLTDDFGPYPLLPTIKEKEAQNPEVAAAKIAKAEAKRKRRAEKRKCNLPTTESEES